MAFQDEEILKLREKVKAKMHRTLEGGYCVNGDVLAFARTPLFEQFTIMLPESFIMMPEELARVKYPSEFRPDVLITSTDIRTNLGFSLFGHGLFPDGVEELAAQIQKTIEMASPDCCMYETDRIGKTGGWYFAFRSHALDSDLYNMIMVMPVRNRIMQSNFNCFYPEYIEWKPVAVRMWESIEMIPEEGR